MKNWLTVAIVIALIIAPVVADAQCVMCRAVAEDSATSGGIGRGLNTGILYLMGIPYFLLATLYFAFFRKRKRGTEVA